MTGRATAAGWLALASCVAVVTWVSPGLLTLTVLVVVLGMLPGWMVTDEMALDLLGRVVVAIAVSLSVSTVVSTLLMYAGLWSWRLTALTVLGVALALRLVLRLRQEVAR